MKKFGRKPCGQHWFGQGHFVRGCRRFLTHAAGDFCRAAVNVDLWPCNTNLWFTLKTIWGLQHAWLRIRLTAPSGWTARSYPLNQKKSETGDGFKIILRASLRSWDAFYGQHNWNLWLPCVNTLAVVIFLRAKMRNKHRDVGSSLHNKWERRRRSLEHSRDWHARTRAHTRAHTH